VLAKILYDDKVSRQFDAREPEDADTIVSSMLPLTQSIPTNQLYPCYVRAMEMRAIGNTFPVSGLELLQAWKELKGSVEMESIDTSRLLTENAAGACLRCDKEGREIHLDGSIGGVCDHRPFTEEERAEASRVKAEIIARAQEEANKRLQAKRQAEVQKPKFVNILMECNQCHRRVDNDGVMWKDGDICGAALLDESQCRGQLYEYKRVGSPFPNL
jgi:hypothetical protein